MKNKEKYRIVWLAFVHIKAKEGFHFDELIEMPEERDTSENFIGAWANVLTKAKSISDSIEIIRDGLSELNFEVVFIDKIENMKSLIEYNEVKEEVKNEADWLLESSFVFKISDKLFPYV